MVTDIAGEKFGRLTVQHRAPNDKYGNARWLCLCDCGNSIVTLGHSLRSGHTKSCGCYHHDVVSAYGKNNHPFSKGQIPWNKGKYLEKRPFITEIRRTYGAMKQRCYNANNQEYEFYGGRGIDICAEWKNFEVFYDWAIKHGYNTGLTIERINNNKGYSPENCRFATRAEQNRNTSRNNKVIDTDTGTVYVTAEVARMIGVNRSTTAKWYREEGLRTLSQFIERFNNIVNFNAGRTRKAKGVVEV